MNELYEQIIEDVMSMSANEAHQELVRIAEQEIDFRRLTGIIGDVFSEAVAESEALRGLAPSLISDEAKLNVIADAMYLAFLIQAVWVEMSGNTAIHPCAMEAGAWAVHVDGMLWQPLDDASYYIRLALAKHKLREATDIEDPAKEGELLKMLHNIFISSQT